MKTKTIHLLTCFLFAWNAYQLPAQTCPPEHLGFYSQEQIDEFPQDYPDCDSILGSVVIGGGFSWGIYNLDSLKQIKHIEGDLYLSYASSLKDLSGLEQLETVNGAFDLSYNDSLKTTSHLQNLREVGNINILANRLLPELQGFNKLQKIQGRLEISSNKSLTNLTEFKTLSSVGDLIIHKNDKLQNLSGLAALKSVVGDLVIRSNPKLKNLEGLDALGFIGGNFIIESNDTLEDLSGIQSPKFRGLESLQIRDNNNLKSLASMSHWNLQQVSFIFIEDNEILELCSVNSICNYLSICKTIIVSNNSESCANFEMIESSCKNDTEYDYRVNCKIVLYPNPSSNSINIYFHSHEDVGKIDYKIIDITGRLLMEGTIENNELDISGLSSGTYSMRIETAEQQTTKRFVKL